MPEFAPAKFQPQFQLTFEGNWPSAVAFVGNERLAAANLDGELCLWDLNSEPVPLTEEQKKNNDLKDRAANCHPVRQLIGHNNGITTLLTADDGKTLISTSYDHTIRLWDTTAAATGQADLVIDDAQRRRLIKRDKSNEAEVLSAAGIEVATQTSQHEMKGHTDWITAAAIDPRGKRLLTGDDGGKLILWDLPSRKQITTWHGHPMNGIASVAISADAKQAFVAEYRAPRGSFDRPPQQAKFYSLDEAELLIDMMVVKFPDAKARDNSYSYGTMIGKWAGRGFMAADLAPDGKLLAVGQGGEIGDAKVYLIDTTTGKEVRTVSGHKYGVCDVQFTADSKHLLTSGRDTTLRIIQVDDGKEVAALMKSRGGQFKDWLSAIALSPDQTKIAAADIAGIVHVWTCR